MRHRQQRCSLEIERRGAAAVAIVDGTGRVLDYIDCDLVNRVVSASLHLHWRRILRRCYLRGEEGQRRDGYKESGNSHLSPLGEKYVTPFEMHETRHWAKILYRLGFAKYPTGAPC